MRRPDYRPGCLTMRPSPRIATAAAALLLSLLAVGCVYRMDIQQGNLLDAEQIEQVEVGMTRSQVRFLLGTPMVIDSFNPDRWDYVYRLQRGHKRKIDKHHLVVWFESDKVARIEELIPVPRKKSTVPG
jgi:outer membrane protein assembly factor BamE